MDLPAYPFLEGRAICPSQHPLSVAILFCGKMGTAILQGLVLAAIARSAQSVDNGAGAGVEKIFVTARRSSELFDTLAATINSMHVHRKIQLHDQLYDGEDRALDPNYACLRISVVPATATNTNHAAQLADVVILCCKPAMYPEILGEITLRKTLVDGPGHKILSSVLGGVSTLQLEQCLGIALRGSHPTAPEDSQRRCTVVRAIPNIAARIQQSMTVLVAPRTTLDHDPVSIVTYIFSLVGAVRHLPESQFNIATALASSAVAFYARLIASTARGSQLMAGGDDADDNAKRLAPHNALWIAAHAAQGASGLILHGIHPDDIESQVSTKGGSTEVGLLVIHMEKVEEAMTLATADCARKTASLSAAEKL